MNKSYNKCPVCGYDKLIDKIQNKEEISEQLQSELDKLAEEGNKYFDNNEYDKALEIWKKALKLIPEPKKNYSETVWFLTSIGDIYFMQGKNEEAFNIFEDAKNNLSGEGINNPFILLMKNGDGEIFSDFYETLKIYGENDIISDGFDFYMKTYWMENLIILF